MPGIAAEASIAFQSKPWCRTTGERVRRSTATAAKGSGRSSIWASPTIRRNAARTLRLLKSEA